MQLDVIEPRQAHDTDKSRAFNFDIAVFATPNYLSAIPFACMGNIIKQYKFENWSWSIGSQDSKPLVMSNPVVEDHMLSVKGFMYVLSSKSFVVSDLKGRQYKSYEPVTPIDTLIVTMQDFLDGGGILKIKSQDN